MVDGLTTTQGAPCPQCGGPVLPKRRPAGVPKVYCGDACGRLAYGRRRRLRLAAGRPRRKPGPPPKVRLPRACALCTRPFLIRDRHAEQKYCSHQCAKLARSARPPVRIPEIATGAL
jgi:DNA-directed RNA polymerase subunit RPC12/RpoP